MLSGDRGHRRNCHRVGILMGHELGTQSRTLMTITDKNFVAITVERVRAEAEGYDGNLSAYLRSLWAVTLEAKIEDVTYQLLHDLIVRAFRSDPIDFDPIWFEIKNPDDDLFDDELELVHGLDSAKQFELVRRAILFHVADYHRMRQEGILDQEPWVLYYGIDSPTGWRWYNFHPVDFIKQGLYGHQEDLNLRAESHSADWVTLADIMLNGSTYE